jgi:threonyl-tRNA synthetase
MNLTYTVEEGEAAFYGPKIDFIVKDALGRKWQLGTVQVDYVMPERFDLLYVGSDGQKHRPVVIHRAPFGSLERFIGVLIEHLQVISQHGLHLFRLLLFQFLKTILIMPKK